MFDIIKPQHPRQLEFLMLFTHVGQEEHVEWVRGSKNGNKFKTRNEQLWFLAVFVFGDNCCTGDWEPETAFEDLRLELGLRLRHWDWGRYYFRFVHRLFLSFACSFSIASSVLILMLLPHPCCFEISRICRWDRFRYTGSDGEGNKFPVYAPFVWIACFLP